MHLRCGLFSCFVRFCGALAYGYAMSEVIRILGIDPGATNVGWGVIDVAGARLGYVASGTVRAKALAQKQDGQKQTRENAAPSASNFLPQRLAIIFRALSGVVDAWAPAQAAVEKTFVNASARDALTLGQARGVALLVPAMASLPVAEYAPNTIKKAVTGRGHGDKTQVQAMVKMLLPQAGKLQADEADALAIAICHANHAPRYRLEAS